MRHFVDARDQDFCGRMVSKQSGPKLLLSCDALIAQLLVLREGFDEMKNERQVAFDRRSDSDFVFRRGHNLIIDLAIMCVNAIFTFF